MMILDTSGLLAALFEDQNQHEECAEVLRRAPGPFIISPFVLAELDYLILKYAGVDAETLLLEEIERGIYELAFFNESYLTQARKIIEKYRDLRIGLADASVVLLADAKNTLNILTLDERHFRAFRSADRRRFRLFPADMRRTTTLTAV